MMYRNPIAAFACLAALAACPVAAQTPSTLSGELETGSVDLQLGQRYLGPGIITMGNWGAKRQVVLPNGEWIVLAGYDHRSTDATPVGMAAVVFGQFAGGALRSLLVARYNRSAVTVPSGSTSNYVAMGQLPAWPEATACEAPRPNELFRDVQRTRHLTTCAAAQRLPDGGQKALADVPGLAGRLQAALSRLSTGVPRFDVRSELQITDQRFNYLGYLRLDKLEPSADATAAEARVQWLRALVPLAENGFGRHYEQSDLKPATAAPRSEEFKLPD